jgi:hypothetical protein
MRSISRASAPSREVSGALSVTFSIGGVTHTSSTGSRSSGLYVPSDYSTPSRGVSGTSSVTISLNDVAHFSPTESQDTDNTVTYVGSMFSWNDNASDSAVSGVVYESDSGSVYILSNTIPIDGEDEQNLDGFDLEPIFTDIGVVYPEVENFTGYYVLDFGNEEI